MQKGGEMEHMVPAKQDGVATKARAFGYRAARGFRRALVSGVAIIVMMVAYGVSTIGAIGTSALGITSVAAIATVASTTPASARRWRRRRRYRGYGYGYPYRRRRRRRSGVYLYF